MSNLVEDQPQTSPGPSQNSETQSQSTGRSSSRKKDTLLVMVLNATDTFEYESSETGKKKMFHATGATLDNLYHMKVFNIDLKEKFTKNKFLLISNYIKNIEFLIIDKDSSVFKVTPDEKIEIPNSLTKNVRETPQISAIQENTVGKLISGLFVLHKKKENKDNTIYEIKDASGSIQVVGNEKWHKINCNEGDKLQLFCLYLRRKEKKWKLVCKEDSFIKVIKSGLKEDASTAFSSPPNQEENGSIPLDQSNDFKISATLGLDQRSCFVTVVMPEK